MPNILIVDGHAWRRLRELRNVQLEAWRKAAALRRLANPRLETQAFLTNAKIALEAMGGTVSTRDLFNRRPSQMPRGRRPHHHV